MKTFGKWLLFAPLEETMASSKTYHDFLVNASEVLGRTIYTLRHFAEECYMYRRIDNWKKLVHEFAKSLSHTLLLNLISTNDGGGNIECDILYIFAHYVPSNLIDTSSDQCHHIYHLLVADNIPRTWMKRHRYHVLEPMIENRCKYPIIHIAKRAFALMRVCKHLPRDIRKLLCYVLNSAEVDLLVLNQLAVNNTCWPLELGLCGYRQELINSAIEKEDALCLQWVLRRCGLRWKYRASIEYLICMNVEECYIPNKSTIIFKTKLFECTVIDIFDYHMWFPILHEEIALEKAHARLNPNQIAIIYYMIEKAKK